MGPDSNHVETSDSDGTHLPGFQSHRRASGSENPSEAVHRASEVLGPTSDHHANAVSATGARSAFSSSFCRGLAIVIDPTFEYGLQLLIVVSVCLTSEPLSATPTGCD